MSWIDGALLESPIPPPVWMPTENVAHARARMIVDATLGRRRGHPGWHQGHYVHDLGRAYPLFSAGRIIPGDEIEAAVEAKLTHLNPPIVQGWSFVAAAISFWFVLLALAGAAPGRPVGDLPRALLELVVVLALWLLAEWFVGSHEVEIEVCDHGIAVRQWTDVWRRDQGLVLGMPEAIRARLDGGRLYVAGPDTATSVSLRWWPPSSRRALADDLQLWGITLASADEAIADL